MLPPMMLRAVAERHCEQARALEAAGDGRRAERLWDAAEALYVTAGLDPAWHAADECAEPDDRSAPLQARGSAEGSDGIRFGRSCSVRPPGDRDAEIVITRDSLVSVDR